jgi:CheY-like chemotaxis protein
MTTVLVVDDSAADRALVSQLLTSRSPWSVETAINGADALARMESAEPDAVVTDLQMPKMDGLELVTAIRRRHPGVPVVLMTAYGSETLAIEALEKGAASYVPKSQVVDKLVNTLEKALSLSRADRTYEDLIGCITGMQFTLALKTDAVLIDPLVDLVQQMAAGMGFCDASGKLQIGMALKEALLNALFHGSLELSVDRMREALEKLRHGEAASVVHDPRFDPAYRDRRIFVCVSLSPEEARFVVRDEGPGFDAAALPDRKDPIAIESGHGRGLTVMRNLMDEVSFNEAGNEVTLVKRREHEGIEPSKDCER